MGARAMLVDISHCLALNGPGGSNPGDNGGTPISNLQKQINDQKKQLVSNSKPKAEVIVAPRMQ